MEKQNRQQVVCDYIFENYVQSDRLRHDVISNRVQIKDERLTAKDERESFAYSLSGSVPVRFTGSAGYDEYG